MNDSYSLWEGKQISQRNRNEVVKWTQMCKELSVLEFQIRGTDIHYSAKMLEFWLAIWKI